MTFLTRHIGALNGLWVTFSKRKKGEDLPFSVLSGRYRQYVPVKRDAFKKLFLRRLHGGAARWCRRCPSREWLAAQQLSGRTRLAGERAPARDASCLLREVNRRCCVSLRARALPPVTTAVVKLQCLLHNTTSGHGRQSKSPYFLIELFSSFWFNISDKNGGKPFENNDKMVIYGRHTRGSNHFLWELCI